ncbi:uncharacterized protein SPPG_08736 [Spizellomyces punctatus DAOM BR117]|uniref:Proline-rich protein PRCC n=1 Tax=Spizellomyces punctatus (strain DAOM BR117) TaxID=645134 RepID=A0A0L0H3U0_SPIPD|nr:uncharacterized protein SPPG_08736 [Spizellomyces punctatus DAOM BR117]KNC95872.1 hypothetical protein SPPG_08736 [Spizellomyces punctatus DAOM BR117]|eukprot:XP_016603912.1 hypothetical protein SPPG_08736 [Spizellomyces punctatus DAOM BR117]
MSLVPLDYGSSDDDDETSQGQAKAASPVPSQSAKNPHTSSTGLAAVLPSPKSNSTSRSSLFASLPPPTQQSNATKNVASQPSERKKVKIFVDLPMDDDVLENIGAETDQTKPKKGSSLFAMLPAPKKTGDTKSERVAESSGVTKPSVPSKAAPAMVPYSLSKKKVPTKGASAITSESTAADNIAKPIPKKEEEPEVGPDSFFTLPEPSLDNYETSDDGPVLQQSSSQPTISASAQYACVSASSQYAYPSHSSTDYYTYDSNAMYAYPGGYGNESITPSSSTGAMGGLSEADLRAFGTRDRKLEETIEIKEISQSQLMGDARQLEATRSASMTGGNLKGLAPSRGQKRKHNIMSLAFEAKQREEALKDMAAHRIASKQSTRAKYGF